MKKIPWYLPGLLLLGLLWLRPVTEPTPTLPLARPVTPHLTRVLPEHLSCAGVVNQLRQWTVESPGLTSMVSYGRTSKNRELVALRLTNHQTRGNPEVLITGAIHGNEPLSTSVVLGVIGKLLSSYGTDADITQLLDTRDIYFIPVVSPDSYPYSRQVDGVDPNRDFGDTHSPTIAALKAFYQQHHFRAAISGHTFGRVFLYPPGDTTTSTPDDAAFRDLFGRMAALAHYNAKHACELYGHPIHGSDVDFYYKTSHATACVMEMGTASEGGQRPATPGEIRAELEQTLPAFLLFLREAPVLVSP